MLASVSACSSVAARSAESPPARAKCAGGLIRNATEMASYSECRVVEGDLEIRGSTLETLEGLAQVRRVSGRLVVSDNPRLDDLRGLRSLRSVGSLVISRNPRLTTVHGLEGIRSVRELYVERNAGLISLGGLSGLGRADSVRIANNPRVCAQMGLLPAIREVDDLVVADNAGLSPTDVRNLHERVRTTPLVTPDSTKTPALVADGR